MLYHAVEGSLKSVIRHLSSVTLSNVSRSSNVVVPKFKTYQILNIPFYTHTIFFLVRKYYHIRHTKHHCQQNKSAVAMLPCVVCSFEALSEKHLRMHMQNEHDDSVITCEKCNKSCKEWRKFKTHMNLTGKLTANTVERRSHTIVRPVM